MSLSNLHPGSERQSLSTPAPGGRDRLSPSLRSPSSPQAGARAGRAWRASLQPGEETRAAPARAAGRAAGRSRGFAKHTHWHGRNKAPVKTLLKKYTQVFTLQDYPWLAMENLEHVKPQSRREPKSQVLADRAPPNYHHQLPQLPFSYLFEEPPTKMMTTPSMVHQSPLRWQRREKSSLCGLTRLPPLPAFHFPFPCPSRSVTPSRSRASSWEASRHIAPLFPPPRKAAHTTMTPAARGVGSARQLKALILTSPPQTARRVANRLLNLNNGSQRRLKRRFRK